MLFQPFQKLYNYTKRLVKHCKGKGKSSHQPWWDDQCENAKYAKYAALRLFRLTNQDNNYTNYIEPRKAFKLVSS